MAGNSDLLCFDCCLDLSIESLVSAVDQQAAINPFGDGFEWHLPAGSGADWAR